MPAEPMRMAVVVLAGGEARRMQGAKTSRVLAGRTLLERALERAAGYSDQLAISVRTPSVGEGAIPRLVDDPSIPGPLAGVASALSFARDRGATAVLTIPCDAPFLPDDLPQRLAAVLGDRAGVAIAMSGGRVHPVCALWRAGQEAALKAYAATGRGALMGLADAVGWTAADWPIRPVDPFFNVNTPHDLARAEQLLASGGATGSAPPRR